MRLFVFRIWLAAILALSLGSLAQAADETGMFRANPAHTGVYSGSAITDTPVLKWKFHTGGRVIATPAIEHGVAYFGSTDGNMYAVDAGTGRQLWKFKTKARIVASAAVSNGIVFFGSYDGNFYALDSATGTLKWKFATAGERRFSGTHLHGSLPENEVMPDPFDFFMSSPVVWKGTVYFGSGDGNVYALNSADGTTKWTFNTGNVVHASPAIGDGTLFIGSWDSYFYALDAATGAEKWRFKTGDDPVIHNQVGIQSSAAIAGGIVYFGCRDSKLYALDEHTGKQVWAMNNDGSWVIASPAVRDGVLYTATSDSGKFYALDARTGAQIFSLDFKHWPTFSSPAVVGNMVYVGSHTGKLFGIDTSTHSVRWEFATDGAHANGATYTNADGTPNYAPAFNENFYDALIVGVDRMMSVGAVLSSPVPYKGDIYFGSMDGNLYALSSGK